MGDIGDVKLDLPIEPQDRPVKEAAAPGREAVKLREYLRVQQRDRGRPPRCGSSARSL
jgi:hypothetical protein